MSDDFTADEEFAETRGVWWAGIVFASIVTYAVIGGLLIAGIYVLNDWGVVDISYWLPAFAAALLTVILVTVSVKRGKFKYKPQSATHR